MIIPPHLHIVADVLLKHLEAIPRLTEQQVRFIGTLKKAIGQQSNNEKRKHGHR